MYVPGHFAEDRTDVVTELVRGSGFGHLVVAGDDGLASTPVPFVVDDELSAVRFHVARPNRVWRAAPCEALLIVAVSDAYVSPGWYASKAEHGEVVPTWNYEVVHVHGRLVAHDEAAWLARQIRDLTDENERMMSNPWSVDDPPDGFVAGLQRGIVGIELEVVRVSAKRKLSQNRPVADRVGVIAGLEGVGRGAAVATAMRALD
jgi:transcriptional regulator